MKKFPKLRYPSHEETDGLLDGPVVVLEKLDGANFRFKVREDGTIVYGSRNVKFTKDGEPLPLDEINKSFRHAVEYVEEMLSERQRKLLAGKTIYGEAMHKHSIEYESIKYEVPPFGGSPVPHDGNVVIFDVREENGEWLHWDDISEMFNDELFGFINARVLAEGPPDELEDGSFQVPDTSMFGGEPEGIVVRRKDGSVRTKKVTESFREKNAVSFEDPSKAESDAAEFVAMFVTKARIEKIAHKLIDRGEYDSLQMKMMEQLPKAVLTDVMEEEGWTLLTSGGFEAEWDGEFKGSVRSKTSKKCARVLKEMCQQI